MGTKVEPEPGPQGREPGRGKSEKAARRVEHDLERGVPAEDLDQADAERVAEAQASPQPPSDERTERPRGAVHEGTGQSAQVGGKPGDPDQEERDKLTRKGTKEDRSGR
ncbi:hypothetical protein [Actinocorallia sp. A-T 12471]|uniref:hypothetical protein n=1 Tax=Actinocorallia sp. A-T 12471 TaxID=3089813 RepID=UPI0029CC02FE|nr:hypothetical protein [Actinocorallia sp. A-T 12471]MDX6739665.1 hypothetical protein [Actinocorallia sp. A-T 12471]